MLVLRYAIASVFDRSMGDFKLLVVEFAARVRGQLSRLSLYEGKEIESIKRFEGL
jgi:hypothetical protein